MHNLKQEEFAKLYALTLRIFDKCVYLSPNTLVCQDLLSSLGMENKHKFIKLIFLSGNEKL